MRISPIVLLVFAVLVCGSGMQPAPKPIKVVPNGPKAKAAIEAAIREAAGKPTGELTKADLEKVTRLDLIRNKITDLKPLAGLTKLNLLWLYENQITDLTPLAGLTKLEWLELEDNPNLTKAEIGKLQNALPKCYINHNATK